MKKKVKLIIGVVIALALAASAAAYALTPLKIPLKTLTAETANVTFTEQGVYATARAARCIPSSLESCSRSMSKRATRSKR
jgi:hypothetical protein